MAQRIPSSKSRHALSTRRAQKRRARQDALRRELELREHSPADAPVRAPRLKTRNRTPLWKTVRRAAIVLAALGLVELGVASLTAEPFQVKSLDVAGCDLTDTDRVLGLSQPLVGQNFIRADRASIEAQIEKIPTVKDARVSRVLDWPPRLHVQVEERVAFARVGAGENWHVVDESGVAFRVASASDENLYAVTSPKWEPQLGVALPAAEWRSALEITQALQSSGQQSWSLRRIYFDKDGSAALRLSGGFHDETLVRLGSDHWGEKLVRARQALSYFEDSGQRAAVLNLVSYERPQWTPRASTQANAETSTPPPASPAADTFSET